MRSNRILGLMAVAGLLATVVGAPAPLSADVPSWVQLAPREGFPPWKSSVAKRPAILLETDFYVYGPGTGFSVPQVNINMDSRGYDDPATIYLYWMDRESGNTLYYTLDDGFVNNERDIFNQGGDPVKVFVPDLTDFQLFGPNGAFGPFPASLDDSTGQYQFVFEVRDGSGLQVIGRSNAMFSFVDGVINKSGTISSSETWTSNNAYRLATPVRVTGGTLTIQPGTFVLASQQNQGALFIQPGAKLDAEGNAMQPIVFTSELPVGERSTGDWGGLVISGNAPCNGCPRQGEGDSGSYGGGNPNDSSGTIAYVRVEFAGILFNEQNELNGIALQGVGSGTEFHHVQVHWNADDGIEFFGGTVDAKYILITDANDDSFDWTFGWVGRVQHVVCIQRFKEVDNGIEADNDEFNFDNEPRSDPTIYNGTWIGSQQANEPGEGMQFRRGTYVSMNNFILMNFENNAVEVSDVSLENLGTNVTLAGGIIFNNDALSDNADVESYLENQAVDIVFEDAGLPAPNHPLQPMVDPVNNSPARDNKLVQNPPNQFFDNVSYLGGVNPNDPWIYEGWTTFSDN